MLDSKNFVNMAGGECQANIAEFISVMLNFNRTSFCKDGLFHKILLFLKYHQRDNENFLEKLLQQFL